MINIQQIEAFFNKPLSLPKTITNKLYNWSMVSSFLTDCYRSLLMPLCSLMRMPAIISL